MNKQLTWKDVIYIATLLITVSTTFITVKIQSNENAEDIAEIKANIKDYNLLTYKVDELTIKIDNLTNKLISYLEADTKSRAR